MSKVQKEHVAHEQLHGGGTVEEPAEVRAAEERHRDENGIDEPATETLPMSSSTVKSVSKSRPMSALRKNKSAINSVSMKQMESAETG